MMNILKILVFMARIVVMLNCCHKTVVIILLNSMFDFEGDGV